MGFLNTLLGILGFGIGLSVGLLVGYFIFIYFEPDVKEPVPKQLQELDSKTLRLLLPDIPLWMKCHDYDRVDWLNKFILEMWPYLDKAVCNTIRSTTRPIFEQYIGKFHIKSIEFDCLTLGSLPPIIHDVMAIPGLYRFVQENIKEQIANLYHWPQVLEIPLLDGCSGAMKKPVGILRVKVLRAINLLKMDLLGKSDPYVKLSLSGERLPSKKTTVKMSDLNPEWNEDFKLIVKDPETQVLQLHVYDWEKVKAHDKMGMQVIPLRMLAPYETKLFTLDLLKNMNPNDPQNKRNRGKIMVELTFAPFRKESSTKYSESLDGEENVSSMDRSSVHIPSNGGVLSVAVERAENVEGKHHNNPYALVIFRGDQKKTKVIKRSRDPRWDEEFQFVLEEAPMDERIHIEVMSKRRGFNFYPKESLGHVNINLTDVVNNGRINEKYHLINSRSGIIHVEVRWSTV